VDKYIPCDMAGNNLDEWLFKTLGELNKEEITFFTQRVGPSPEPPVSSSKSNANIKRPLPKSAFPPKAGIKGEPNHKPGKPAKDSSKSKKSGKSFKIYLPNNDHKSTLFKPDKTLKQVLEKLCANRPELSMDKFSPQDMDGKDLDINKTLSELNLYAIQFKNPVGKGELASPRHETEQRKNSAGSEDPVKNVKATENKAKLSQSANVKSGAPILKAHDKRILGGNLASSGRSDIDSAKQKKKPKSDQKPPKKHKEGRKHKDTKAKDKEKEDKDKEKTEKKETGQL